MPRYMIQEVLTYSLDAESPEQAKAILSAASNWDERMEYVCNIEIGEPYIYQE
jgi:hypothetical protein